ncbi:MAG: DNA primase, partial [Sulfurovaceae bacterium]
IQLLTIDTLKKELRQNMIVFYEGTLKRVYKNDNIPYEKKKIIVRKIKSDILPKLRRGEFVAYEGISAL